MYRLEDFKQLGIYIEKPDAEECEFEGGKVISNPRVSSKILELLRHPGGNSYNGDCSRQDSAVITSLLSAGYSPSDVFRTFVSSARGKDANERKPGHLEDYVQRTIKKSLGFLSKSESISVDFSKKKQERKDAGIVVSMGYEIETEKVNWVWPAYIPAGKLTLLAGDPGMGKSTIFLDLISRISKGTFLPSGIRSVTGTSLILSAEDAAEDTITPRLIACGADLKRVGVIRGVKDDDDSDSHLVSLPRDLKLIKDLLKDKGCRTLIIDPLNAFLEKGVDTYKDQDMRGVLHPLSTIAEETGTAILVVAHLTKKEDVSTLYRVGGTIGFIGAARSVLAVSRLADDSQVFYFLKGNLAARPASLAYEIKQVHKRRKAQEWLGEEVINSTTIRWLGEVEFNPFSKNPQVEKPDSETADFLRQVLQDAGEVDTEVIFREARTAGITRNNLTRTKTSLGIKTLKRGSSWLWQWPER